MATYRAEDVAVKIDGQTVLATNLSFKSSLSLDEDRRMGKRIGGGDFLSNGPQRSSLSMNFYITGNATGTNPVFSLLKGRDIYLSGIGSGYLDELNGATLTNRFLPPSGNVYEFHGDYHTYKLLYDSASGTHYIWRDGVKKIEWQSGLYGTGTWNSITGSNSGAGKVSIRGFAGCSTGSLIQLNNQAFASGVTLKALSFPLQPFSPIVASADFEIYNPVTGIFPSQGTPQSGISPSSMAHGMFSSFSGITGISDMEEVSWAVNIERVPRYVVGQKNVHDIRTLRASKDLNFKGWGKSSPVLENTPTSISINLGSENGSVFADTVSGKVIDDSFDLPAVGIMAKNFRIIQNML